MTKETGNLKVAFFGTSDRSIPILAALKDNFELVLCITKKDTVVGRDKVVRETGVKKWAKANNIMVMEVSNLKGIELEAIISQATTLGVGYGVVADFSFIIPYPLIEHFGEKLINIHFSLLPVYRGSSPVQFAILNGDETTGITYLLIDKKLDGGKIIHQIGYKLAGSESSEYLWPILFNLAAENLPYVLKNYHSKQLETRKQDETKASYTYSPSQPKSTFIYKEDAKINWKAEATQIDRVIRAFTPWPIAWTALSELENNKKLVPSKLLFREGVDKALKVKIYEAGVTAEGKLEVKQLQIEGKNKTDWKSFENGYVKLDAGKAI